MGYEKWIGCAWTVEDNQAFQDEMTEELRAMLEAKGLQLVKSLPNMYCLGAVAATADGRKFLHITTPDVREDEEWFKNIRLRRMSSERDWKGDAFHYCTWDEIGESAVTYMGDEYDDEIL